MDVACKITIKIHYESAQNFLRQLFLAGSIYRQKRREGGARGGGCPPNVLQDHFSNSSNSGVKIAGGGVRPMSLAIMMCVSMGFYNLAIFIAFSHDLYGIDSNFFLMVKPPDPRSMYAPRMHISST